MEVGGERSKPRSLDSNFLRYLGLIIGTEPLILESQTVRELDIGDTAIIELNPYAYFAMYTF